MFKYDEIEKKIGYTFNNKELLRQAFVHSSYANEYKGSIQSYERLEFLGDAILEMVSSVYLYEKYPNEEEGILTKNRAKLVCTTSLSNIALHLDIAQYIILGKGELSKNIEERTSILEDVIEAIIGAIYLDSKTIEVPQNFIIKNILNQKELLFRDYKSEVQELLQSQSITNIEYRVINEQGPEHEKIFTCILIANNVELTQGCGKSKKAANQEAAKEYLKIQNLL